MIKEYPLLPSNTKNLPANKKIGSRRTSADAQARHIKHHMFEENS